MNQLRLYNYIKCKNNINLLSLNYCNKNRTHFNKINDNISNISQILYNNNINYKRTFITFSKEKSSNSNNNNRNSKNDENEVKRKFNIKWIILGLTTGLGISGIALFWSLHNNSFSIQKMCIDHLSPERLQYLSTWKIELWLALLKHSLIISINKSENNNDNSNNSSSNNKIIMLNQEKHYNLLFNSLIQWMETIKSQNAREIMVEMIQILAEKNRVVLFTKESRNILERMTESLLNVALEEQYLGTPIADTLGTLIEKDKRYKQFMVQKIGFQHLSTLLPFSSLLKYEITLYLGEYNVNYQTESKDGLFQLIDSVFIDKTPIPGGRNSSIMNNLSKFIASLSFYSITSNDKIFEILSKILNYTDIYGNQSYISIQIKSNLAHTLVNLSNDDKQQQIIVSQGWLERLNDWMNQTVTIENKNEKEKDIYSSLQVSSLIALANLLMINSKNTKSIWNSISPSNVLYIAKDTKNNNSRHQSLRLLANLSAYTENDNNLLYMKLHKEGLQDLLDLISKSDIYSKRNITRAIGNMARDDQVTNQLLVKSNWNKLILLSGESDKEVTRNLSRIIANIAFIDSEKLVLNGAIYPLLNKWSKSPDDFIRSNAIRTRMSIATPNQKSPKYAEGIYLLYPTDQDQALKQQIDFDIVFIHGVVGHPFTTWGTTPLSDIPESVVDPICWPQKWLPEDLPNARVITVGYDAFLSSWGGGIATPLFDQSQAILENLTLAGVGSRPLILVTHSFGGLVAKQMLKLAHEDPQHYGQFKENTKAVVFYATPHYGAKLAHYAHTLDLYKHVLRTTSAISDLLPSSQHVDLLTRQFPNFAGNIATLCFGETDEICFLNKNICLVIVDEESANPKFIGDQHQFSLLKGDHRSICKPFDKHDEKYRLLVDFIKKIIYNNNNKINE